jgi:LDH2 family malate/lactate/ureidoglycolate dehydrogenase
MHTKNPVGMNIGHFFMAIDRGVFRESDDFQTDVATFTRALRATTPVAPRSLWVHRYAIHERSTNAEMVTASVEQWAALRTGKRN